MTLVHRLLRKKRRASLPTGLPILSDTHLPVLLLVEIQKLGTSNAGVKNIGKFSYSPCFEGSCSRERTEGNWILGAPMPQILVGVDASCSGGRSGRVSSISFLFIVFQLASKRLPSCGFSCTSISSLFCASDGVACPPPLEVEGSSPHVSVVCTVPDGAGKLAGETVEVEDHCLDGNVKAVLKSVLKKEGIDDGVKEDGIDKGRVQWMDFQGRELVEVKEFEASDWDDSDDDENDKCLCVIQ